MQQPLCEKDRKFSTNTNLLFPESLLYKQSASMKECLGTTEISHIINEEENCETKTSQKIKEEEE